MEINNKLLFFIDESGDNVLNIEKSGVTNFYIIVAVVIEEKNYELINQQLLDIRKRLLNGRAIKSSNIGSDHETRMMLLNAFKDLCFGFYGLIIDKSIVYKDSGLQYKRSFYKYTHKMLHQKIESHTSNALIYIDNFGSHEFMDGFKEYINENFIDLFKTVEYDYVNSKEYSLIQLADFVAGTLAYAYDPDKNSEYADEYKKVLDDKRIYFDMWPSKKYYPVKDNNDISCDERIKELCLNQAYFYIDNNRGSLDIDTLMRISILNHLILAHRYIPEFEGFYADALIEHLVKQGFEKISRYYLCNKIIGVLRDSDIVICGSKKGYRLVTDVESLRQYLTHDKSIIIPMLKRLNKASELIGNVLGANDIFDALCNPELGVLVSQLKGFRITSDIKETQIEDLYE